MPVAKLTTVQHFNKDTNDPQLTNTNFWLKWKGTSNTAYMHRKIRTKNKKGRFLGIFMDFFNFFNMHNFTNKIELCSQP